ncbi:hypothetical protein H1R20_g8231, partial [Candolleomyces eurysporus]
MPTRKSTLPDEATLTECQRLQQEEFEVLESIYPEYVSSQLNDGTLKLEVPVELERNRKLTITCNAPHDPSTSSPMTENLVVSTLPPLLVYLALPHTYPLHKPPQLLSIRATHLWLPNIERLSKLLTDMWQAGDGVLYAWIEYLRTGEFLQPLDLSNGSNSIITIEHSNPPSLAPLLAGYDKLSQSSQFARNAYPCSDFWGMCIEEGDVGRVGCPDPDCVKEKREANEEEVARIVSDAEVQRWRWLREKRDLERDPRIIHCPVEVCQAAVKPPANEDPESGWARFRQCPKCMFSFCAFCRRTWHGPISPCVMAHSEKVVMEYLAAEEDSEDRWVIEQRYGKKNIVQLVLRYQEEVANKEWLDKSTTGCPGCSCHVEKTMGCNHASALLFLVVADRC